MNKKILVIGAGLAQVDAIIRAKELGYFVLASDGSKTAPGLQLADEFRIIDVKDIENNLEWARQSGIDGVTSYASDIALSTVLSIREQLGLPGLGHEPLEVSLDKSRQRILFAQAGLAQPEFSVVTNEKELKENIERIGFPLVAKPVDNSGSRGVSLVFSHSELYQAFTSAQNNSSRGIVILEQFLEGVELTVEGISIDGEHHILAISDKFKPQGSYRVATQLAYPANISTEIRKEVVELMVKSYTVAGIDNTPTHSEVIVTKDGPKIVEIGCRGGGFYVFTRVVEAASGYDIVGNWTRLCAGDPVVLPSIQKNGVVLRFFAADPGKLVQVTGFREAMELPDVCGGLFIKPGENVPELTTDGSRTGWMITTGKGRSEAIALADRVSEMVHFEVRKPC
jgi:biotin carboxylase